MESNLRLEDFGVGDSEEDLMRAFELWFSKLIQELESSSREDETYTFGPPHDNPRNTFNLLQAEFAQGYTSIEYSPCQL